jgi:hypothetical protein
MRHGHTTVRERSRLTLLSHQSAHLCLAAHNVLTDLMTGLISRAPADRSGQSSFRERCALFRYSSSNSDLDACTKVRFMF